MVYKKNIKPNVSERLSMPTPHYFKRLTKRILLSLGGLVAIGITITTTVDLYGLDNKTAETVKWIGGIIISIGVVGGGIGAWVANLVYDDKEVNINQ